MLSSLNSRARHLHTLFLTVSQKMATIRARSHAATCRLARGMRGSRGAMIAGAADDATVQVEMSMNVCSFAGLSGQFGAILIDPPWRFANRTGKVGPEHKRLHRYQTLSFDEIAALPIERLALPRSHLYLW